MKWSEEHFCEDSKAEISVEVRYQSRAKMSSQKDKNQPQKNQPIGSRRDPKDMPKYTNIEKRTMELPFNADRYGPGGGSGSNQNGKK